MEISAQTPECVLTPEFARSLIRSITSRTGSAVLDDDLAQEALLRGVKAFHRAAQIEHPRAFFSKIVRDTVCDHWRRQRVLRAVQLTNQDENEPRQFLDVEGRLDRAKQLRQIRSALSLLSPKEREVIELFYFEGLSIRQLSLTMKKSRSALKMALLRGRNRLVVAVTTGSDHREFSTEKR